MFRCAANLGRLIWGFEKVGFAFRNAPALQVHVIDVIIMQAYVSCPISYVKNFRNSSLPVCWFYYQ